MTFPIIFTSERRPLPLGNRIGKGGEGEVYALAEYADMVVKLYTVSDLRARESKIRKMIADGLAHASPLIAFPVAIACDARGAFAGFIMKKVNGHQALHELYSPGARKAAFPRVNFKFLVRAAANISRAVAAAHNAACVIGDINHSGILISDKAIAALIDADSFQIADGSKYHPCKVGVPEYTPPELQGQSLDKIVRTQNHDAFGLAVVIFQLLWMGRHPYAGRYSKGEMPIDKAIREFRFAYTEMHAVGMEAPPAVPALREFPRAVGAAFEVAFGPVGVEGRPTARQWIALLGELEQGLRHCSANSLHHYPQEAPECPWCRMEQLQGVQLFVPYSLHLETSSGKIRTVSGDVSALWRAIDAVQAPSPGPFTPHVPPLNLSPSTEAKAAHSSRWKKKAYGAALLLLALAIIFTNAGLWLVWLIAGGYGLNWLFSAPDSHEAFLRKAREVEQLWYEALYEWERRVDDLDFVALKNSLLILKREAESLPAEETRRLNSHASNRRAEQLRAYLDRFQIRQYKITGIGPSKLATLTSYGIETAADVTSNAVQNVPGFGPINSHPLLEWRRRFESQFVYSANPTATDRAALAAIKAGIARQDADLRRKLAAAPAELRKRAAAVLERRAAVDPDLHRLHTERSQVAADLKYLRLTMPTVPPPPRPAPRRPSTQVGVPQSPQQVIACPTCGGAMIVRLARRGRRKGNRFYGCSRYPACRGTRSFP